MIVHFWVPYQFPAGGAPPGGVSPHMAEDQMAVTLHQPPAGLARWRAAPHTGLRRHSRCAVTLPGGWHTPTLAHISLGPSLRALSTLLCSLCPELSAAAAYTPCRLLTPICLYAVRLPPCCCSCLTGGENGLNQAIELSAETLANVKFVQEKRLISRCVLGGWVLCCS